ncbi:hypothetical protein FRC01_000460 [Tulasnella sp. 417]|nr:hypothetical protein FRC01_000460 [Tulasnella sp. 417]
MSSPPTPNNPHRPPLCSRRTTLTTIPGSPDTNARRASEESLPSYTSRASIGSNDSTSLAVPGSGSAPVQRRPSPLRRLAQNPMDNYTSMPLNRRTTRHVEEGRDGSSQESERPGVLASILDLYSSKLEGGEHEDYSGLLKRRNTPYPMSVASSRVNSAESIVNAIRSSRWTERSMSMMSSETELGMLFDEYDPRITGIKNRIDDKIMRDRDEEWLDEKHGEGDGLTKEEREEKAAIERNLRLLIAKQNFILKLARALMLYGAPSHRLESQLVATAKVLSVPAQFIHFPGVVLMSFHDKVAKTSETHIVKATTRLQLGKLHRVHMIYRSVVHSQIGVTEGAARLVWAVSYTLFLGFSLTVGSDLWFILDSGARHRRQEAADSLTTISYVNGTLFPDADSADSYNNLQETLGVDLDGFWTFVNKTSNVSKLYHYQIVGCYRDPSWEWWRQPLPIWSLFILVPLYSLFNSFWNLQPWKSKQLPVMVSISCFSYAARKALQHFIGPRNEVVSAMGAFVIGVLGNVYARVFKGTAFTCMVTAVCFLVPSGLAAAGGLAMNYQGTTDDQYTSSIVIGVRMLSVAIGTTVGLLFSSLVVYAFGPKKKSALFAF